MVRMVKKANKCVLEQLSGISIQHIKVKPKTKQYLSEKSLELPTVSSLTNNKQQLSCVSSISSVISSSNGSEESSSVDSRKYILCVSSETILGVSNRKISDIDNNISISVSNEKIIGEEIIGNSSNVINGDSNKVSSEESTFAVNREISIGANGESTHRNIDLSIT